MEFSWLFLASNMPKKIHQTSNLHQTCQRSSIWIWFLKRVWPIWPDWPSLWITFSCRFLTENAQETSSKTCNVSTHNNCRIFKLIRDPICWCPFHACFPRFCTIRKYQKPSSRKPAAFLHLNSGQSFTNSSRPQLLGVVFCRLLTGKNRQKLSCRKLA